MSIALSLIAIFFLIVLSAFFNGSETALTAASRARMHALEEDDNAGDVVLREHQRCEVGAIAGANAALPVDDHLHRPARHHQVTGTLVTS